ncbi:MAG: glycosyltransferase family 39 protein [Chloroflexi bacterium]|nr:glycosyltransferase family 39 protein [Chloroflexota bacterium]
MAFRSQHLLSFGGRVSWSFYLLLVILVVALGLRLNGVNWDQGYGFHPDERDIYMRAGCMYDLLTDAPNAQDCGYLRGEPDAQPGLPGIGTLLDADRSPLNPHWFPLGSILIYLMVFFRSIAELFTDFNSLDMRYFGRPLSALADVGTVAMVFVLGRKFYGKGVGLLAAALTAVSVIHIQNSHFFRPETFSVFFTLASFWAMWRMVERKRLLDSALLGLMLGLAIAPKVSVLPILAPLLLVYCYRVLDEVDGHWSEITPDLVQRIFGHAALAGVVAAGVFFITSPYAILDVGAFVGDLAAQTRMARSAGLWPFTIQYIGTPAFIYQIQQSSVWGLGIPLGVAAWLSIPFTAVAAVMIKGNRRADLFLLAWVVPGFIFLETFEVRFLRYIFPIMPVMIIMGARMLLWTVGAVRPPPGHLVRRRDGPARFLPWASVALVVFVVGATAFYALAFQRVYSEDHPAVTASEWINANVPQGTAIVSDNHWDEFLPNLYNYDVWQFPVYDPDTQGKMDTLAAKLASSEYVVFYSSRPYASAARAPDRFPFSNRYYQRLFAGGLGYELDRSFTTYPELFGVSFRDDAIGRAGLERPEPLNPSRKSRIGLNLGYADDNAVGYDHPQVLIFRNSAHLNEKSIRDQFRTLPQDATPQPGALMLSEEDLLKQQEGGTFSDIVDRDGWTNDVPVLVWLLVVEIIYLAALPFTMFIFRPLPDRGIVLARILGLLVVSYVAWLAVSLGWMDFSRYAVYAGMAVAAGLSLVTLVFRWDEITGFLKEHWRLLLFGEALFLVAFLGFVLLRYANPDLWHPFRGGEKPMELAYLTAVVRSTTLPPFDPWFAGGYLNYYYWGYFVVSSIIRVTGILPTTAFNLAVPMFFALTVTGAYSLVYNLAEGVRQRRVAGHTITIPGAGSLLPLPIGEDRALWRQWAWSPIGAGLMAGLFTAVIGNLGGLVKMVQNTWHRVVDGVPFPAFDYWLSSRMLPDLENFDPNPLAFWVPDRLPGFLDVSPHITEFPFFTFLFADLHAHMMVIPFTLLVIGLGLNLVVGLRAGSWLWTAVAAAALALGLGSLWAVNSWDYPTYVILIVGLLSVAVYFTEGSVVEKLALLAVLVVGVVVVSLLAFLPFHLAYETFNSGLDVSKWRTPVDRFLGIHGLFLFVIASFLLYQARNTLKDLFWSAYLRGYVSTVPAMPWLGLGVAIGLLGAVFFGAAGYWNVVLLVVFLTLAGIVAWEIFASKDRGGPFAVVPLVLLAMALFIGIGVDLVVVEGDIGRMNTFFKFYLELWVLLSIVSAYMLWHLGDSGFLRTKLGWRSGAWLVLLAALIGSSLIYTALGSRSRLSERFTDGPSTLDGTAYMAAAVHQERSQPIELKWDLEAIEWLQDNVEGSPVVLEAHLEQYRWGARIANYTGLPTVLGWPWHQTQQRMAYSSTIPERAEDIREMYETTDVERALDLLRQYRVKYVVVGDLERIIYAADGLRKFENLARKVFENQGTTIYEGRWN